MSRMIDHPLPKQCRNKHMNKLRRSLFLILVQQMRRSKAKHIAYKGAYNVT
jgi:hypothetical protein